MSESYKPKLAITIGDYNGIGPELIVKTLADHRLAELFTPVIYGSSRVLNYYRKLLDQPHFTFYRTQQVADIKPKTVNVVGTHAEELVITPGNSSAQAAKHAWHSLQAAARDLQAGLVDGLVTAPVNKKSMHSEQTPFVGHTQYLADLAGNPPHAMLFCCNDLRVALATGHIPLFQLVNHLTTQLLVQKLEIIHQALVRDWGIDQPRLAVLGVNPHAGEEGLLGSEEQNLIAPALAEARSKRIIVFGPYSADGFFAAGHYRRFDAVLAMYHDQGLIPFKTLCFENGVNVTIGLPFVRTSPDHGVAYDLAGKNVADTTSFRNAIFLAIDLVRNRRRWAQTAPAGVVPPPLK